MWLLALLGCEPVTHPEGPPLPAPSPATQVEPGAMPSRAVAEAEARLLSPSPAETRKAVRDAGVDVDLATLVPRRLYRMDEGDRPITALRTGVLLADLSLTVLESNDHDLLERLTMVDAGLGRVGVTGAPVDSVRGMIEGVRAGGAARPQLLQTLDELVARAPTDQELGGNPRLGALIQAGAWVATTDLVAAAVLKSGKTDAADALLRQAATAAWFQAKLREEGQGLPPTHPLRGFEGRLSALRDLGALPTLGAADVTRLRENTQAMLDLL